MKRGSTDLSFLVGIDKPQGMTSHDVVSRCRKIFGERRIGHTGTLDPMATGAMIVCVGPATRLNAYLTSDEKSYRARIAFGVGTDTDDGEGQVIARSRVPEILQSPEVAQSILTSLVGSQEQVPPAYSAVKVGGVKAYDAARKGSALDLKPRTIEIFEADLVDVLHDPDTGALSWDVDLRVSKGTYIRSIARDLGESQGTHAHIAALRRMQSGYLEVADCVSLESLAADPSLGRIDPVEALGCRFAFLEDDRMKSVSNGSPLAADGLSVFEFISRDDQGCCCTGSIAESLEPLREGEIIALVFENKLVALYGFDADRSVLRSRCGFSIGVSRGSDIHVR